MPLPLKHSLLLCLTTVLLSGCTLPYWGHRQGPTKAIVLPSTLPGSASPATGVASQDPLPAQRHLLQIDAFVISVPAGSISRNDSFWKRVDEETGVSPTAYQILFKNGVRVGLGRVDEWAYFREIIDSSHATTATGGFVAMQAKELPIPMNKEVSAQQSIFYFNAAGELVARTYEQCDELWVLSFEGVPRRPDNIFVSLTPMVRSLRKRLDIIDRRARPDDAPQKDLAYINPEYLFDLNVQTELSPGRFFVIAPSSQATPGSLGDAFLTGTQLGQKVERILLLVPRSTPASNFKQ